MEFHSHSLKIKVLLDDSEEENLQKRVEHYQQEMKMPISADDMLKKLIEDSITEVLKTAEEEDWK